MELVSSIQMTSSEALPGNPEFKPEFHSPTFNINRQPRITGPLRKASKYNSSFKSFFSPI
jgi:hypothetical protein